MKKVTFALALFFVAGNAMAQAQPPAAATSSPAPSMPAPQQGMTAAPGMPVVTPQLPAVRPPSLSPEEEIFLDKEAALVRSLRIKSLEAKIAEEQRKIDEANKKPTDGAPVKGASDSMTPFNPVQRPLQVPIGTSPPAVQPKVPVVQPLPFSLVSVWGEPGNYRADVVVRGMRVTLREGDRLPAGWIVKTIGRTGILVANGKKTQAVMLGG